MSVVATDRAQSALDWAAAATFADVIALAADAYGYKAAFRDKHRELSFIGYRAEVDAVAAALRARGLQPGDRIAILSQNRIESTVLLGLCRAGFVPVPVNWRLAAAELSRLLEDCEPAALFVEARFTEVLAEIALAVTLPSLLVMIDPVDSAALTYADLALPIDGEPAAKPDVDDVCCLLYTSGTTGLPKGVLLTHGAVVANCHDLARDAFAFTADDVSVMAMPLFHVGGIWYYLFPSFASGCTTLIRERFDPEDVVETFEREAVTNIHIVPTMLSDLVARDRLRIAATALRLIVYAGSSMPSELLSRAMAAFPNCHFAQAYGSTEGGSITALSADDHDRAERDPAWAHLLRSCGRPIGTTQIRIEPQDDRASEPMGEILITSDKLMAGYWRRPDETAEKMAGGWMRTGDVGHIDSDGYLYIVDRKNDMIISGGENVFPFEVEEVLCRHDAVAEAAVFGVPDPRWVERLVAAVVLEPGAVLDPAELVAFARQHLAGYKTPKSVLILPGLPRSAVGKILRKELRAEYIDLV